MCWRLSFPAPEEANVLHTSSRLAVLLVILAFPTTAPTADPPLKPPTKEQVAEWIKGLASDLFDEREKASKALWKAGKPAEAALRQVLKSGDPEAIRRAREILNKFDWGIYPDTPEVIVTLIDEYRSTDTPAPVMSKLLDQGSAGHAALMKIATMEKDPHARTFIWNLLAADMPRLAAAFLAEGADARLDEVLQQALSGEGSLPHAHYAAYLMGSRKLDDRLRDLQKKAGATPDKKTAMTLAYLCRAKGDLTAARKYAETAEDPVLLRTILVEQGDWKALLAHIDKTPVAEDRFPKIGLRLACLRLMGDRDGFATELNKAMSDGEQYIPQSALVLNSRPDDALTWLTKTDSHWAAAHLLSARLRFRQALEATDRIKAEDSISYRSLKAHLLAHVGERKLAREAFDKLVADVKVNEGRGGGLAPIITEYQAGLRDEAFAHLAELLPKVGEDENSPIIGQMLRAVDRGMPVEPWWKFLRNKYPGDDGKAILKRLRDLYEHKASPRETADWLKGEYSPQF